MITPQRIEQWTKLFRYEETHRYTVVRFCPHGCQFLAAPGVFVEENELGLAWAGSSREEAVKRLWETFDILKARNEAKARLSHRSSRILPVYDTHNPWADFPWPSPRPTTKEAR